MELSEIIVGIFFIILITSPIWIGVIVGHANSCPQCRRFWVREMVDTQQRKDVVYHKYRCRFCGYDWEDKKLLIGT